MHPRAAVLTGLMLAGASWPLHAHVAASPRRQLVRATAADLLNLAEAFERRGESGKAQAIYVLLSRDPAVDVRSEARFRSSMILAAQGKRTAAAVLLRRILDEKPDATRVRLELARLLDQLGDKDGAWRQLRAAQAAGLPPAVARMVDRFSEALRAAKSSGGSIEVAVAPDSNINHATSLDHLATVFGNFEINKQSKAKSGLGLAVRGQAYRRLALGRAGDMLVRVSESANLYQDKHFDDVALDFAAGPELRLGTNQLDLEAGLTQRWFGQKPYMRSIRLGATLTRPLGRRMQLRVLAGEALVDNRVNDLEDGRDCWGEISLERALSTTSGVAVTVSGLRESLRDPGYSNSSWRGGVLGWHDLGRVTLTANAEFGRLRGDQRLSLFPERRSEVYSRLAVGATVRRLSFRGFAPVARIIVERNKSSIAFYDYRRHRLELGLERAF